jgi:AraC-like DNA-binding protein
MTFKRNKEQWVEELTKSIAQFIHDPNFTAKVLAQQMDISERQLYRRVKDYISCTPNEYINQIRFQKARAWIEAGKFDTVAETARAVGSLDPGYFSKKFKERFGVSPKEV